MKEQSMDVMRAQPHEPYPTEANVNIHSPRKDKWFGACAIIDTGTKENWISEDFADRCSLRIEAGGLIQCSAFNGEAFESDRIVKATWRGEGVKKTQYTTFHVGKNAPFDVLFGTNLVQTAPLLFRGIPTDPSLVLVQQKTDVQ